MTELHFVTNSISTAKEVTRAGRAYLVSPVVALREGVLNEALVLEEEFGKYPESWEGRVTPVDHPQINGLYVSANLLEVVDTEVTGNFHNVQVKDARLKGEIWIDLERATQVGDRAEGIVNRLRAGESVEVSTGYFADEEETAGIWNGKAYKCIHRNIRPDHLALLSDGIGACSWDDGCGTPRVNQKGLSMTDEVKVNELTLDDRASLVRRAFWTGIANDPMSDPYELDVISIFDSVIIAKDWGKKAHIAYNYTIDEAGNVTIGAPTAVDVVYRAKEGGAEVVIANKDGKQRGILTRLGQWLGRDKTDSDSVAVSTQQEENEVKRCDATAAIVANKQNKLSKEQLDKLDDATLQAIHDGLAVNEDAAAPVVDAAPVAPVVQLPQEVVDFAKMIQGLGGVEALGAALGSITANADQEKAAIVADLVANEQCQLDEADLQGMSINSLRKLAGSFQVRDYSGGVGVLHSNGDNKEFVMEMPKVAWAVSKEAK